MNLRNSAGELLHGALGVPQGGGVGGCHHKSAVGASDGGLKTASQTGGAVQQDIFIFPPRLLQERFQIGVVPAQLGNKNRSRQQRQTWNIRMGGGGPLEGAAAGEHVGEIHQRLVGHAQGDIQIAQPHVQIHAERFVSQRGQTGARPGGEGGLSGAALSRDDCDYGTHSFPPGVYIFNNITGSTSLQSFCAQISKNLMNYNGTFCILAHLRG
ncbi:hypothetical protein SDC9_139447 [bioreactor metagenome]|uniref:Uncharacterized protein n=1 Tax=bioreactor metagenome TaxID=1076179 RepID=A0A645DVD6_9ZZZZ